MVSNVLQNHARHINRRRPKEIDMGNQHSTTAKASSKTDPVRCLPKRRWWTNACSKRPSGRTAEYLPRVERTARPIHGWKRPRARLSLSSFDKFVRHSKKATKTGDPQLRQARTQAATGGETRRCDGASLPRRVCGAWARNAKAVDRGRPDAT